ncbi:MAG TPA: SIR2 family protein [Candidatus Acidoferrum sp.]|nr:SIR2 family protein [Candidatus Acidoferrum sp.]
MLNATDQGTFLAIRELKRSVQESGRPLVFWIGSGASKWLEYPLWKEVAHDMRRDFFKYVAGFDNSKAVRLIQGNFYPEFFQQCRDLDRARYYGFLSQAFLPRPETPLYRRFADSLGALGPVQVLTTNIDEALDQRFPSAALFQRSDFSGCIQQLQNGKPFIAKLHGSRGAIESAVFTRDDYEHLRADTGYISTLRTVFSLATVVFLGYSVTDQYVVNLLSDNARDMSLFGAGPHFVVSPGFKATPTLRQISYSLKRFADHRSALTVLDVIRPVRVRKDEVSRRVDPQPRESGEGASPAAAKTAYFISDIMTPGTFTTSVTAKLEAKDGRQSELTFGLGFTNDEIPFTVSPAAHDVVVGLICFDFVYFSLLALGKVHLLLGEMAFWQSVTADIIRFVHLQHEPAIVCAVDGLIGDVGLFTVSSPNGKPEVAGDLIRRQIHPVAGNAGTAEKLIADLEGKVTTFGEADRIDMAGLVRASIMMPEVARLLGIGDAITPAQVPRWLMFPYLRMAHLVHTGTVCDRLGIQAAKIPFGGVRLTSAAFGVQASAESADQYASYLLSGRFNTDLGAALISQPAIFQKILGFRNTAEGEAFRREVRQQLLENEASEFSASVNAGLTRNIPLQVLEKARDKLSSLLTEKAALSPVPAVWTNSFQSDDTTWLWRAKSRSLLLELARQRGIGGNDPCICESGDKLRLCCLQPLKN